MYRCQNCHTVSKSGEKLNKVPVMFRKKTYDIRDEKGRVTDVTHGKEIAQEMDLCERCDKKYRE